MEKWPFSYIRQHGGCILLRIRMENAGGEVTNNSVSLEQEVQAGGREVRLEIYVQKKLPKALFTTPNHIIFTL